MPLNYTNRYTRLLRICNQLRKIDGQTYRKQFAKKGLIAAPNLLEDLSNEEFKQHFCLDKDSAIEFYSKINHNFDRVRKKQHKGLNKFLMVVFYLANNNFQYNSAHLFRVSQGYFSKCIAQVLPMITKLSRDIIRFPWTYQEIEATKQEFRKRTKFHDCIGAVDGTHVRLHHIGLKKTHNFYGGHRKCNSLNVQMVVDAKMKILDVVARWPGTVHDASIFRASKIYKSLSSKNFNGYVLADKAYPFTDFCFTPFCQPNDAVELEYNRHHRQARVVIERTFGAIKNRFFFLRGPTRTSMKNTLAGIVASCVLWNFLLHKQDFWDNDSDSYTEESEIAMDCDHSPPIEIRTEILQERNRAYKYALAERILRKMP